MVVSVRGGKLLPVRLLFARLAASGEKEKKMKDPSPGEERLGSRVADHLCAAFAVVDVGPNLDHSRRDGVVCRCHLLGSGASQAADDGDLYRRAD